jgi:plastocyanin
MKKILILLIIAAFLLATSGCTESAPEVQPTPPPVPTKTKAPSPTYLPKTTMPTPEHTKSVDDNIITIKKEGFSPATLTVKKGDRVTWLNLDTSEDQALYNPTHRIRVRGVFDSQLLTPGTSGSWIFTKIGKYAYSDLIHTDLDAGYVVVEA